MNCSICGRKSGALEKCKECRHFLKKGVSEENLRSMHRDERTKKIWKENEAIAEEVAQAYYNFVIDEYPKRSIQNDTKENFGFNTFVDGIRCGIDIVLPLLDDSQLAKARKKIKSVLTVRKNASRHKMQ